MSCMHCQSGPIMAVTAKCSDACFISVGDIEHDGYVPRDLGIGGGDYVEFDLCLNCGRIQGQFPINPEAAFEDASE